MRGRKPEKFQLKPRDKAYLRKLLRDGKTPWRIARRAQILLQPADKKQRLGSLNEESAQSASTIGGFANVIATAISKLSYTMLLDRVGRPFVQKSTKED